METFNVDTKNSELTIVSGLAIAPDTGALVISVDELFREDESHSILAIVKGGKVTGVVVEESCRGLSPLPHSRDGVVFLGEDGGVWTHESGSFQPVVEALGGKELSGPLRAVGLDADNRLMAVGAALQVYTSKDGYRWNSSHIPVSGTLEELANHGLESMCAHAGRGTYCVGWAGDAFLHDRNHWSQLSVPTNVDLYAVHCGDDGNVYMCGEEGVLLKGIESGWTLFENEVTTERFWGIATFGGRTVVSSDYLLYEIKDDQLVPFSYSEEDHVPTYTNTLSVGKDILWSVGSKQLFQYDGKRWTELFTFAGTI
ncbi:MAG: hypothetical protein KJO98_04810 [Rhodothermia bacterium]|nr:hypothetical protein [Rhodothermia bacterium]